MDIYSSSLPYSPLNSIFLSKCSNSRTHITQISRIFVSSRFSTRLVLLSKPQKFAISAHFGRGSSNGRNSLRKKLIDDRKVSIALTSSDENRDFDGNSTFVDYGCDDVKVFDDMTESNVSKDTVESSRLDDELQSSFNVSSDPALLSKLESSVGQYIKDVEVWGIGSGPIFTIFQDLDGTVKRVAVDEDEILRRNGEFDEDDSKLLRAKNLAKEIENGISVIPTNSSIAKFIVSNERSGFLNVIQGLPIDRIFSSKLPRVGAGVLCCLLALWTIKSLLLFGKRNEELMPFEKEMLRRKIAARMEREEKEKLDKGSVEVVKDHLTHESVFTNRPKLDKQEVMNTILNVKASSDTLALRDSSSSIDTQSVNRKIQEIREMARKAREIEQGNLTPSDREGEKEDVAGNEEIDNEIEVIKINQNGEEGINHFNQILKDNLTLGEDINGSISNDHVGFVDGASSTKNEDVDVSSISTLEVLDERKTKLPEGETITSFLNNREAMQNSDSPLSQSSQFDKSPAQKKSRIIRSVKEAREYLSSKRDIQSPNEECQASTSLDDGNILRPQTNSNYIGHETQECNKEDDMSKRGNLDRKQDIAPEANYFDDFTILKEEPFEPKHPVTEDTEPFLQKENWLEKNFHELEPVVKKIGVGFQENYDIAKTKVDQEFNICSELDQLRMNNNDDELDWMKDDYLREIVFRVRENELTGKDPFYMINAKDKVAFFDGLKRKADKVNQELAKVHEYLHSNIENLDYGADGISIYDPPEKIMPRWKGPPLEKSPEFLDNFMEQRNAFFAEHANILNPLNHFEEDMAVEKSKQSPSQENLTTSAKFYDPENKLTGKASKKAKIVIEGSDGSVRTGKKTGKEYWQHTKKWSRGFVDSYSAETDPEIKSVMKDMGKDLDRWITEKEIEEAAQYMKNMPEKNKEFMEKKLEKLKREMELFGPEAVVSKYREYGQEKKEDYLWWLDLPFVLCIELYTDQNEEQKVGFYSLEMAEDLELDPKQYHVIAFQDAGDCKNLCYIIQAHMEMLGNGNAFVVARPPKDVFREAKANGFSVTVIKKGELKLNMDQPLEEVEEDITEIGSKIYHDKITSERSVDISSLMEGVFGFGKATKRTEETKQNLQSLKNSTMVENLQSLKNRSLKRRRLPKKTLKTLKDTS